MHLETSRRHSRDPLPGSALRSNVTRGAEQPIHVWYAAQQSPSTDVIADLSGSDEQVERATFAITDSLQLCIHAAFGSANQAATPPFLTPKLDAVRWASR